MTLEDRQHGVEPARRRDRVIVQENQDLAARNAGGAIAAADKTNVGIVAHETHPADDRKCRLRRFRRGVVENHDLVSSRERVGVQACEAGVGEQRFRMDRDDDAHAGIRARRK